jgi:cytochrome c oxidase subunit II
MMIIGKQARAAGNMIRVMVLAMALMVIPQLVHAQAAATASVPTVAAVLATPDQAVAATVTSDRFVIAPGAYVPRKPVEGVGMPVPGGLGLQTQFSPLGHTARWLHDGPLMILVVVMSVFVLGLLIWVAVRYNSRANPVASKNSHNTVIEVVWTLLPALILFALAFPSLKLLAAQFKPEPATTLTIKATGNQWYWTYTYPDNGGIEVVSNMLKEKHEVKAGERFRTENDGPEHLAADTRLVVPVGEPIRMQVTGADVIHALAVPSLWFKIDGVPGRINEKTMFVEKPGVYYGQCSELCGARHGYMPIVVEALPRPEYNRWVLSQSGGVVDGMPKQPAVPAVKTAPAPAVAPIAAPTPAVPAPAAKPV